MIIFKTLTLRNFMSVGDNPLTLDLNTATTTLITGGNGAGKSSIGPEGLTYALFGKSFRGLNKPKLINTVNQKGCVATLDFIKGKDEYKIVRGMKPNIFEIHKNGKPLDESSTVRDFQQVLEDIIGFSYNEFTKTIVLGNANYKPFLQLSTGERRIFVESLLGLTVFSDMNKLLKNKMSALKEEIQRKEFVVKLNDEIFKMQTETFEDFVKMKHTATEKRQEEIQKLNNKISELEIEKKEIQALVDNTPADLDSTLDELIARRTEYTNQIAVFTAEKKREIKNLEFFSDPHIQKCNTCFQKVSKEFKDQTIEVTNSIIAELTQKILRTGIDKITVGTKIDALEDKIAERTAAIRQIADTDKMITAARNMIAEREQEVGIDYDEKIEAAKAKKKEAADKIRDGNKELDSLKEMKQVLDIAAEALKDTGIKSTIISKYIPMLNSYINHYLEVLDFGVQCILDEQFNDVMKGRFANEFEYANLSQGERTRIDLAILFALRQVSAVCSGVSTNLLFLDEIADSSLDSEGVDALFTIIDEACKNQNVHIISHRQDVSEKCSAMIRIEKVGGFTRLVS